MRNTRRSIDISINELLFSFSSFRRQQLSNPYCTDFAYRSSSFDEDQEFLLARHASTHSTDCCLSVCLIVVTLHESQREHPTGYSFSDCSSRVPPQCLAPHSGIDPLIPLRQRGMIPFHQWSVDWWRITVTIRSLRIANPQSSPSGFPIIGSGEW